MERPWWLLYLGNASVSCYKEVLMMGQVFVSLGAHISFHLISLASSLLDSFSPSATGLQLNILSECPAIWSRVLRPLYHAFYGLSFRWYPRSFPLESVFILCSQGGLELILELMQAGHQIRSRMWRISWIQLRLVVMGHISFHICKHGLEWPAIAGPCTTNTPSIKRTR